jgi:AAA+ superfamily predicted ATPase
LRCKRFRKQNRGYRRLSYCNLADFNTGTGKTTTAQKMGKVFYDMGFLSQAKVEECSATDLIGQYVGQTGPKVQKLMEKAMGSVLFIDEGESCLQDK